MFKKIFEKLEKMTTRKLLTIVIPTGIALLILFFSAIITQKMILIVFLAILACPFWFCAAQLITNKRIEYGEAKEERLLNEIKLALSEEEYREVEFKPDTAQDNWTVENLNRCLRIVKCLKVKHFAKIADDGCIIVIARDANGETIGIPDAYTPKFFNNNYKVLK